MGKIARLEVENFKSYGGKQTIGPFARFTAVVGPNGAGKSNLMDAISFVLGVQSRQLRSNQLKDLVHKSTTSANTRMQASVALIYEMDTQEQEILNMMETKEIVFTRCISEKGAGSYRINARECTYEEYENTLKKLGILIKARNFLVFQGDVESIASKSPEQLTKLFELISSSDELRQEYDECLDRKNIAEENTIFAYQKKKGLAAERKVVREQKEEAERFRAKRRQMQKLKEEHFLWQLFQVEEDVKVHKENIGELEEQLSEFLSNNKVEFYWIHSCI